MRELTAMQDQMRRMLREFERGWTSSEPSTTTVWSPPVDIYETENDVVVKAELPGVDPKDVDLRIENNVLTIRAERKVDQNIKEEMYHRMECCYGTFTRTFSIPTIVDEDKIKAEFKNGILTVTLPKKEAARPKQIKISA